MDRTTVVTTEVPRQIDFLQAQQFAMQGLGFLALDILGTGTVCGGLACTATSPSSMAVSVAPGRIYELENLEATAWGLYNATGGLPADTNANHNILKQGILHDPVTLNVTAPVTTGQSVNYLVEAGYSDVDGNSTQVFLYNTASPSSPITATINTTRFGSCVVQLKVGTPAATGTQVTPTPDTGFVGLYVITVPYGATSITAGNISVYSPSPFIPATLITLGQGAAAIPGRLLAIRTFTTGNTTPGTPYVPTTGTNTVYVRMIGAGGSGAGAGVCTGSQTSGGSGGDGGCLLEGIYSIGTLSGQAITIGVGGAATGSGSNPGNAGGSTLFGSVLTAPGGAGGLSTPPSTPPWIQNAATTLIVSTGGNLINAATTAAGPAISIASGATISGNGGSSPFGGSAARGRIGQGVPGFAGQSPGSGGGGGVSYGTGTNEPGGAGIDGQIIVFEYS